MTDTLSRLTAALADRYRIEREIGAGGMATVYLAHDLKHERRVAHSDLADPSQVQGQPWFRGSSPAGCGGAPGLWTWEVPYRVVRVGVAIENNLGTGPTVG